MNKFTPGPWRVLELAPHIVAAGPADDMRSTYVCEVFGDDDSEALEDANAALISAAPDLLDALREFVRRFESADDEPAYVVRARAAIAKAEGR